MVASGCRFGVAGRAVLIAVKGELSVRRCDNGRQRTESSHFTGAWKLKIQKSKFADSSPGDVSGTIEFNHKDNNLTEALTVSGVGGDCAIEGKYAIDGKRVMRRRRPCEQNQPSLAKSRAQLLVPAAPKAVL